MKIKIKENKKFLRVVAISEKSEMNKDDSDLSEAYKLWQNMLIVGGQYYLELVKPIVKKGLFNVKMIFKVYKKY